MFLIHEYFVNVFILQLFELEEQHPTEENAESQENQDDIDSAIVKSLQETTKDMPELKL